MGSYTSTQLKGSGILSENLSGLKTFTFTNPSYSSYFIMETVRGDNGFYSFDAPANCDGVYVVPTSIYKVSSPYISVFVIPPGGSSFTFTPTTSVVGTTLYLRGTGEISLVISGDAPDDSVNEFVVNDYVGDYLV